jgi:hypothetical protein
MEVRSIKPVKEAWVDLQRVLSKFVGYELAREFVFDCLVKRIW